MGQHDELDDVEKSLTRAHVVAADVDWGLSEAADLLLEPGALDRRDLRRAVLSRVRHLSSASADLRKQLARIRTQLGEARAALAATPEGADRAAPPEVLRLR